MIKTSQHSIRCTPFVLLGVFLFISFTSTAEAVYDPNQTQPSSAPEYVAGDIIIKYTLKDGIPARGPAVEREHQTVIDTISRAYQLSFKTQGATTSTLNWNLFFSNTF